MQYLCSGEPEGLVDYSELTNDDRESYFDHESTEMEQNGSIEGEEKSSQTTESILPW